MSRYTAVNAATGRPIAWGFDLLNEYFLTEYWNPQEALDLERRLEADEDIEVNPEVRFSIMSHTTTDPHPNAPKKLHYSNSEFIELMETYPEIPKEHLNAIALDLPF